MNCEMDATVGPVLKHYADKNEVIYTNTDGDEPGVASNMYRFVKTIGLKPILAGNLKGFYDPYRNPDTQLDFALKNNQKPRMMTSFIDGTKLSFELTVLANCLGFGVGKRGMFGPKCADVREAAQQYQLDNYHEQGIVDYLLGAAPGTGAYVIGYSEDKVKKEYLRYLKMGDGASAEKELDRAQRLGIEEQRVIVFLTKSYLLQGQNQRILDEVKIKNDFSNSVKADLLM